MRKLFNKNEKGFSYLEVMIAIVILTVGMTAQLAALSMSMVRARSSGERSAARQIASSTLESIFAARDLGSDAGISSWASINTDDVDATNGIFLAGWKPVRTDSGADGIQGTADDACSGNGACSVGTYTNNSAIRTGFQRKILIETVTENGVANPRKRMVTVKVKYFIGQLQTEESLSTLIADLPFYK
ncbi:MAG: prepilin-type N-terminal cleavage/methylation domain-containing protein [Pyrinomonadaceae bacterium]